MRRHILNSVKEQLVVMHVMSSHVRTTYKYELESEIKKMPHLVRVIC